MDTFNKERFDAEPGMPEDTNILLVTGDTDLRNTLKGLLDAEGYKLFLSNDGHDILSLVHDNKITLIILDFGSINVIEACKNMRANFLMRHISIVVLVDKDETIKKIKCIYAGADDYLDKPVQPADLLARVKANFWRTNRDLDANPLTKLPGNASILKELETRIKSNNQFCVAYADLDKFKEYNDYYGFEWGDRVIKHTGDIISNAILELGAHDDFLGHIGGDDFIFTTGFDSIKSICEKIITEFDRTIPSFYKEEDLKRGYIIVKNREGKVSASSILTISLGVASNKGRTLTHVGEVTQVVTELKNYAKTFAKSIYIIDRRKT